jgi:hypothetical protein
MVIILEEVSSQPSERPIEQNCEPMRPDNLARINKTTVQTPDQNLQNINTVHRDHIGTSENKEDQSILLSIGIVSLPTPLAVYIDYKTVRSVPAEQKEDRED